MNSYLKISSSNILLLENGTNYTALKQVFNASSRLEFIICQLAIQIKIDHHKPFLPISSLMRLLKAEYEILNVSLEAITT